MHRLKVAVSDIYEYDQDFLKNKLYLACAVVRQSQGKRILCNTQNSVVGADSGSQASDTPQSGSKATSKGFKICTTLLKLLIGISFLAQWMKDAQEITDRNAGRSFRMRKLNNGENGSCWRKRCKKIDTCGGFRMLPNREYTRSARWRKQAQLTKPGSSVCRWCFPHCLAPPPPPPMSHRKVKMTECEVIRVIGFNPVLFASPEISTMSMLSFNGSPSDKSTDAAVPMQDGLNHLVYQAAADNHMT
ncbi:uncharacterized protein LOC120186570 [Hibiscus syriacus]|uniref:uncharacterized protein LOC120186570 n=1 Tax=Hibiscus syriacus TaxID=106335 RepID=UPI001923BA3C|nr:uncharacterized protein LOC120186570 [Hibiscus syriacus]